MVSRNLASNQLDPHRSSHPSRDASNSSHQQGMIMSTIFSKRCLSPDQEPTTKISRGKVNKLAGSNLNSSSLNCPTSRMHPQFLHIRTFMVTRRTLRESWCARRTKRWFTQASVLIRQDQAITKFRKPNESRVFSGNLRLSKGHGQLRFREKSKVKAQVQAHIKCYRPKKKLPKSRVVSLFPVFKGLS